MDWVFFPHPIYRQGVLVQLPEKSAYHFARQTMPSVPLRVGQQVVLRFTTREELPGLVGAGGAAAK